MEKILKKIEKSKAQIEEVQIRAEVDRALKHRRLQHQRERAKMRAVRAEREGVRKVELTVKKRELHREKINARVGKLEKIRKEHMYQARQRRYTTRHNTSLSI